MADTESYSPEEQQTGPPERQDPDEGARESARPEPEDLDARERRFAGPRKPMGPEPEEGEGALAREESPPADVPPTEPAESETEGV